jgi:hypothetical protein
MIRVRIATADDQQRLIDFVHDHWSATHIFTQRPDVFAWQHLQADGRLNMVLAEEVDVPDERVLGVLGFIPMGRFDPGLGDRDLLLAIWKVDEATAPPGVGLRLLKFLRSELEPRMIAAIGTSKMVRRIYEVLRYRVGALHQSAIFNPGCRDALMVAANVPAFAFDQAAELPADVLKLMPFSADDGARLRATVDALGESGIPGKGWSYVEARYLHHPWYQYETRLVHSGGRPVSVVVWRAVQASDTHVLRIVDVIGDTDWLRHARFALQEEVVRADAEYIDLMQWGIDPALLADAGFVSVDNHPDMLLPNYFAPFEARNMQIELAVKVFDDDDAPVKLFRADSDQDRPNLVSEVEHAG